MSSKKQKYMRQKRMRSKEMIDTIFIKSLQNFDNYDRFNRSKLKQKREESWQICTDTNKETINIVFQSVVFYSVLELKMIQKIVKN